MSVSRKGVTGGSALRPANPPDLDVWVGRAGEEALSEVDEIAREALPEHWSRAQLGQSLRAGYELRVCRFQGRIVAYLLSQDVVDETHIMQLAVRRAWRRRGMASVLLQCLKRDKRHQRAICLEVRASNEAARALYLRRGFELLARRPGYYQPRAGKLREDALLMRCAL